MSDTSPIATLTAGLSTLTPAMGTRLGVMA